MAQFPAAGQEMAAARASPLPVSAAMPGTGVAGSQLPACSSAVDGFAKPEAKSGEEPGAAQFPADAQETALTCALCPVLRDVVPGTTMALAQWPFVSATTNACWATELSA